MRMSLVMVMELMDPDDFFRWNIMTEAAWIASSKPWNFDQHTRWQWKSMTTEKVMRNPSFLQICLQHTASHTCCIDALLCYDFAVSAPWQIECEPRVGPQVCLLKNARLVWCRRSMCVWVPSPRALVAPNGKCHTITRFQPPTTTSLARQNSLWKQRNTVSAAWSMAPTFGIEMEASWSTASRFLRWHWTQFICE